VHLLLQCGGCCCFFSEKQIKNRLRERASLPDLEPCDEHEIQKNEESVYKSCECLMCAWLQEQHLNHDEKPPAAASPYSRAFELLRKRREKLKVVVELLNSSSSRQNIAQNCGKEDHRSE
jgi:hypothetical protein